MNAAKAMARARSRLILQQPFFGVLALGLEMLESQEFPTMATDGRRLLYNPAFVASMSESETMGVVAHEVMHCAYGHHVRRGERDREDWNRAADYAINRDLFAAGFELPAGALFDPAYAGMGAEEIYRRLRDGKSQPQSQPGAGQSGQQGKAGGPNGGQPSGNGQPGASGGAGQAPAGPAGQPGGTGAAPAHGQPQGSCGAGGGFGEILDAAPAHDGAGLAAAESDWQARVRQAIAVAKAQGAGRVPGELESVVATVGRARIDWRSILRRFVDDSATRDYSWTRPNRRHIGAGLVLPGYVPDAPAHLVAVVDTSGSMSDADLAALGAELQSAMDERAADRLTVAFADTRVHRSEEFQPGDVLELRAVGRGGTAFRSPLAWVGEHCPDASAIVYMTDCDVTDWGEEPAAPLLWLVTGGRSIAERRAALAPFGEPVILED